MSSFSATITLIETICGPKHISLYNKDFLEFNWPASANQYPANCECQWKISAAPSNLIQVLMRKIDIGVGNGNGPSSSCSNDYLEITDDWVSNIYVNVETILKYI